MSERQPIFNFLYRNEAEIGEEALITKNGLEIFRGPVDAAFRIMQKSVALRGQETMACYLLTSKSFADHAACYVLRSIKAH